MVGTKFIMTDVPDQIFRITHVTLDTISVKFPSGTIQKLDALTFARGVNTGLIVLLDGSHKIEPKVEPVIEEPNNFFSFDDI